MDLLIELMIYIYPKFYSPQYTYLQIICKTAVTVYTVIDGLTIFQTYLIYDICVSEKKRFFQSLLSFYFFYIRYPGMN